MYHIPPSLQPVKRTSTNTNTATSRTSFTTSPELRAIGREYRTQGNGLGRSRRAVLGGAGEGGGAPECAGAFVWRVTPEDPYVRPLGSTIIQPAR